MSRPTSALPRADDTALLDAEPLLRGNLMAPECPSRTVLQHVTSRWGVLVLIALLSGGTQRFSELRRRIGGVSERMLAQTLQWLEGDGIVQRTAHPVVPPHVDYRLTPLGHEVAAHVRELADWIEGKMPAIEQVRRARGIVAESVVMTGEKSGAIATTDSYIESMPTVTDAF